jgi:protein arginine kinase
MQIRERLTQYSELETLDRIYRSLGILQNSRIQLINNIFFRLT